MRNSRRAPAPPAARTSRPWWHLALIVAAGAIVYANSLGNPFVFDDHSTVVMNPQIQSFAGALSTGALALTGRPVVSLTFALNYAIGGLHVTGYRVVNLALHVACGLLLFGVVRRTLETSRLRERFGARAGGLALATALVWTVHPLNSEVVDYVTQRTESMMALCYLLTMYASARALGGDRRRRGWQGLAVAACAVGMACKEPMATAPLMVVLYDRVFTFDSLVDALRARWRFYAALAATWVVLAASVASSSRELSGGYATTHVSAWSYLLNQTAVVTHYLELVVWPRALVVYYGWSLPATLAEVLPYAVFITALFLAAVVALARWPRVGFPAMWFFVTLAPSSSVLPIAAEVGADRRMYVPLMGLVALAVIGGSLLIDRLLRARADRNPAGSGRVAIVGLALVVLASGALAARTIMRNRDYAAELTLSQTTLDAWPSAVAHDMVGLSLAALERREDAVVELRQAVADYAPARYHLGAQLCALGRFDEAIPELQRFIALEPRQFATSAARTLLGRALVTKNRLPEAAEAFRLAADGPYPDPQAHGLLADLLLDAQKYDEAIPHYRAYLRAFPGAVGAMANLGIALASTNRFDEAIAVFRRATELEPANGRASENLARVLITAGRVQEGTAEAQRAVAIAPASAAAHDLLGQALLAQQRTADARREFEEALQIDAGYAPARDHLRQIVR